jgi:hypothetical protein
MIHCLSAYQTTKSQVHRVQPLILFFSLPQSQLSSYDLCSTTLDFNSYYLFCFLPYLLLSIKGNWVPKPFLYITLRIDSTQCSDSIIISPDASTKFQGTQVKYREPCIMRLQSVLVYSLSMFVSQWSRQQKGGQGLFNNCNTLWFSNHNMSYLRHPHFLKRSVCLHDTC